VADLGRDPRNAPSSERNRPPCASCDSPPMRSGNSVPLAARDSDTRDHALSTNGDASMAPQSASSATPLTNRSHSTSSLRTATKDAADAVACGHKGMSRLAGRTICQATDLTPGSHARPPGRKRCCPDDEQREFGALSQGPRGSRSRSVISMTRIGRRSGTEQHLRRRRERLASTAGTITRCDVGERQARRNFFNTLSKRTIRPE